VWWSEEGWGVGGWAGGGGGGGCWGAAKGYTHHCKTGYWIPLARLENSLASGYWTGLSFAH